MAEDTTETKISTIEDAVESIIAPSEEPTEEVLEVQETEEISAEPETEEVEEEEVEEIEASDSDDEDLIEEPSQEEPELYAVKVNGQEAQVTLDDLKQGYSGQKYVQQGMQALPLKEKRQKTFMNL